MYNEKYKELITHLDCALTGKPYEDCMHTFNCVPHTPEEFIMGDLYYLSDGGYSRLYWDRWNGRGILVASESLDKVKEAVGRCKELIEDLNTLIHKIELEKDL
jgi:hypothetical protein